MTYAAGRSDKLVSCYFLLVLLIPWPLQIPLLMFQPGVWKLDGFQIAFGGCVSSLRLFTYSCRGLIVAWFL